ncbi:MAG: hypothetical protein WCE21_03170 [Candidatus Babeliales bacterium]
MKRYSIFLSISIALLTQSPATWAADDTRPQKQKIEWVAIRTNDGQRFSIDAQQARHMDTIDTLYKRNKGQRIPINISYDDWNKYVQPFLAILSQKGFPGDAIRKLIMQEFSEGEERKKLIKIANTLGMTDISYIARQTALVLMLQTNDGERIPITPVELASIGALEEEYFAISKWGESTIIPIDISAEQWDTYVQPFLIFIMNKPLLKKHERHMFFETLTHLILTYLPSTEEQKEFLKIATHLKIPLFVTAALQLNSTIIIHTNDNKALPIEREVAMRIGTINKVLRHMTTIETIPLDLTQAQWNVYVAPFLKELLPYTSPEKRQRLLMNTIEEKKFNDKQLEELLYIADYLDIPLLLNEGIAVAAQRIVENIYRYSNAANQHKLTQLAEQHPKPYAPFQLNHNLMALLIIQLEKETTKLNSTNTNAINTLIQDMK